MSVFKTVFHDLKQRVPFKETLPYLQERMASVPFPSGRMSIDFQDFSLESNRAEKLLKRFPQMEKYSAGRGFYASGVAPEDEEMIRDIAALVPRPVFFEDMKIALEDVVCGGGKSAGSALPGLRCVGSGRRPLASPFQPGADLQRV